MDRTPSRRRAATVGVILGLSAVGLTFAALAWHRSWDDTAITLAYSRTLARTGEIRFGIYGDRVEGFSTFLWMLVCAVPAAFVHTPGGLLTAAKLICGALYVGNAFLTYELGRAFGLARRGRLVLVGLYALSAVAIGGVVDGMESHLFLALHLAAGILYLRLWEADRRRIRLLAAALAAVLILMVLTRPEGVVTTGLLALAALLKRRPAKDGPGPFLGERRRKGWVLAAVGVAAVAFAAFLVWRWAYFGQIMPNSVYAKTHPPYWRPHLVRLVLGTLYVGRFVGAAFAPLLPAIILAGIRARRRRVPGLWQSIRRTVPEHAFFVAAFLVYAVYHWWIGGMMGTDGRVLMAVTVFAWAAVLVALQRTGLRWTPATLALVFVPFLAAQGALYARYAGQPVTVRAIRSLVGPGARLAKRLEDRLGRTPRLATPDMGATALWWGNKLELVDLALLNYREAALEGWDVVRRLMASEGRPDVVEIHSSWARASGLARHRPFIESYVKVTVDGRFFFLRRELMADLRASPPEWLSIRPADALSRAERFAIRRLKVTDFHGDATCIPIPWEYALDLEPAASERATQSGDTDP